MLEIGPEDSNCVVEEFKGSFENSQKYNKTTKAESNKKHKKKLKGDKSKSKHIYKRSQPISRAEEEIKRNINLMQTDDDMNDTMKKTLEENNKEREINLLNDHDSSMNKNMTFKYASAPASNKSSNKHESIFSNSMKLAAFRASELKKRNKEFTKQYGDPKMLDNTKYEHDFIKVLHNAALTIQDNWRDFILKKKSLNTEEKNECLSSLKKYKYVSEFDHPNNNKSSSRNT